MKRMILCKICAANFKGTKRTGMLAKGNPVDLGVYPGEFVTQVPGRARKYFRCDYCNTTIKALDRCTAVSIYTEISPNGYYEWEHEELII